MLFNLVGPLIVRNELNPLRIAFSNAGVPWPGGTIQALLEMEVRQMFNERQTQPTSIDLDLDLVLDLVLEGEASPSLFVEGKFVEQEFGGCSVFENGDCCGRDPPPIETLAGLPHRPCVRFGDRTDRWRPASVVCLLGRRSFFSASLQRAILRPTSTLNKTLLRGL